ncbi:MAG: globin [Thiohalorhabdus sp.]|uniref:globin n=1 Tax=Thiohalorhabdus sp. TaxID=3094134 RepID=UPI00397F0188
MPSDTTEAVKKSLGRCLHHGDVFGTFYQIFLQRDPRIPELFANTDMEEQKKLLRNGVNNVIAFYDQSFTAKSVLERIRYTHGRSRLNIPPDLYGHWVEAMIQAVGQFDPDFDPLLEQSWRNVLNNGTEFVMAGYHED